MPENKFLNAVFLDLASVDQADLDLTLLTQQASHWRFYPHTDSAQVLDTIADAEVVVSNKVVLNAETIAQAKNLKLICVAATGTNNIDLKAAEERQIPVCNVTAYGTDSVVQHVFRLLLALTGRLNENHHAALSGEWSKSPFFCVLDYPPVEISGKTMGIVGHGELGKAVAKMAEAFGMKVLLAARDKNDNRKDRIQLHELLPQIDVLSLHCPLTAENRNLIAALELELLPEHAILINAARGGLVDEEALLTALKEKKIAAAGLDVLSQEPPAQDHHLLNCQLDNLLITPHIAWASQQARQRLVNEIAYNIQAYQEGRERNAVII